MDLYIMRHGETQWNKDGVIQGSSDVGLTEYGIELARVSAEGFYRDGIVFDRIYTSPLSRALTTAGIIAKMAYSPNASGKLYIDERLREMCFGKYEGLKLREVGKRDQNALNCFRDPANYVPDETGESFEQVFARVNDFMDNELIPLEGVPGICRVLVICHGTVIRAFLKRINDIALDDFWNKSQPNCSINRILLEKGTFTTIEENILYYESDDIVNRGIL